ncbi:hypothetical protein PFISCL1PPCAC_14041, partial [Pristionchus fissidentatus]
MEEAHRFVKLNSTSTARAPFLIHSIVGLEVLLSIAHCALWPFLCIAVTRAGVMHRNFRIQICLATWYTVIGQIARLVSIFYQINDLPLEADSVMYICDLIKLTVIGYYCSLMGSFAIERYVATHYWRWYERGSLSTLLVLVGAETTMLIPNFVEGLLNLEGSSMQGCFPHTTTLSYKTAEAFLRTYHVNVRLRSEFAQGARVGFYSVSRSFQVNENVVVMEVRILYEMQTTEQKPRYMFAIMVPHSPVILAAFAAFSFKMFGPRNWETSRDVAYALYDLLIIVYEY